LLLAAGCDRLAPATTPEAADVKRLTAVWGQRGLCDGELQKPRAITIDRDDHLYIVDMTARIQVFTTTGEFLRKWQTPVHDNGKPTGLSIGRDGNVLVADTHYFRVLVYSPEGKLLKTMGGTRGQKPGEFGFVTSAVQDRRGNFYVSEYGDYDRVQKFSPAGHFIRQWGGHGDEPGQFARPQQLVFDEKDDLWVTDSCNHRIQIFNTDGKLLRIWGKQGRGPGQLYYPYGLALGPKDTVYICEYGNSRVQQFTRDGRSLACWGSEGRQPGQLFNPWALVRDSRGILHVLDTNNHRVQSVRME
jgi:sugar lactone lactonase YvrE